MNPFTPKHAVICLVALLAMAACKKDKKPRPVETGRLLMKVTEDQRKVNRYEYTSGGLLSRQCYHPGFVGVDSIYMDFTYSNGLPVKMTAGTDETHYFYGAGKLVKMEVHEAEKGLQYYWEYAYENGRLKSETGYVQVNGEWKADQKRTCSYDTQGNLVKKEFYTDVTHSGTFTRNKYTEYSQFVNNPDTQEFLNSLRHYPGLKLPPRLATKEAHFDGNGFEEWTTEYTFRFNGGGLPTERTTVSYNPDHNVISRYTVTYTYNR